jgi:hypothetical protein
MISFVWIAAGLSPQIPGFDSRLKEVTAADGFALEVISIRELHFTIVSVTSTSFHICLQGKDERPKTGNLRTTQTGRHIYFLSIC